MKALFLFFCLAAPLAPLFAQDQTILADKEHALPIIILPEAEAETRAAAELLAASLKRISGREFAISTEADGRGIRIGTAQDLPGLLDEGDSSRVASQMREDYLLRSKGGELLMVGRTPAALQGAVWDLLYRLGYRQFMPGAKWEIWPSLSEIAIAVDAFESPDFYNRTLALAGMSWPESIVSFRDWCVKNRMVSRFELRTTHIYGAIIAAYPEHFKEHPGDLVPNENLDAVKLDASRESVLEIATRFAMESKAKNPGYDSISMDPSDGGGWRADSPLGSPSNQALAIANHVARALQKPYPGTKVGMLAYHEHSPPPDIPVDRHVIVSVAAGFIKGGYTFEELLRRWGEWGNETGVYEYLSVSLWDRGQPGKSRASDITYIARTIPAYHRLGARYYRSEISCSWAPHGLGYYLVSRCLWNVGEAGRISELLEDFYQRSFGAAAPAMKHFFHHYILAEGGPLLSRDLVGRMYRELRTALDGRISEAERARILDFVEYTRFLELSIDCYEADDATFPDRYRVLCEYLWRTRGSHMVNGGDYFWRSNNPAYSAGTPFDRRVERPAKWSDPAHPWKKGEAMTAEELMETLDDGIGRNPLMEIEPVAFSQSLVPIPGARDGNGTTTEKIVLWRENRFFVEIPDRGGKAYFSIRARSVANGPIRLRLFSKEHALVEEPVQTVEIPPDGKEHHIILSSPYAGVHEVEYTDGGGHGILTWPKGQRVTFPMGATHAVTPANGCDLAFYVPRGTGRVGLFVEEPKGRLTSADGALLFDLATEGAKGYVAVPVPEGCDGAVWVMKGSVGRRILINVPPYVARHPSELLVPEETTVRKDKLP